MPMAQVARELGLSADEYRVLVDAIGREPTMTELGVASAMWSEHCSYKSSRVWLRQFPTQAPWVIQGPGENAGVIAIGDGLAAVFKMESHNHPSYIEPYQGAATGVGGILRDVFTMGARPIANLNALHFGAPDHPKSRHLVAGVVAGIGGYGNCIGVPTVGGLTVFDGGYDDNILVNAMTVGLARADRIFTSAAAGIGNPVVYVGAKTGRDGIHGATMASAAFDDQAAAKRPTVQVGDPFTEKLLLEACLELMATDAIISIQDMGAAGLTSSSVEMASKGNVGIELELDRVPMRETGMNAYEIMLSESQERMLMVLRPGAEDRARAIFDKWDLDFAVIGRITGTGRLVLRVAGETVADLPLAPLADAAPVYRRPWVATPPRAILAAEDVVAPVGDGEALVRLMGGAHLASRRWVWEQYDHMVMADTVQRPGGDAAVVRIHGTGRALALTADVTPRYCLADPYVGGAQAVAEAWRNLTAVGAQPLAITDCMNFGNPERPEVMGQFAGCVEGMAAACEALRFPVVSGNVSLYNETNGVSIPPTPTVGGVGLIDDLDAMAIIAFKRAGEPVVLIGATRGHVGATLWLGAICARDDGAPPALDLAVELRHGDFVRGLIRGRRVSACHDLSDGGLLVGIAEMALAGDLGVALAPAPEDLPSHGWWFAEDQSRYLVTATPGEAKAIVAEAENQGIPACVVGTVGGDALTGLDGEPISLKSLRNAHEGWFPALMGEND
ncbi:MAG: phosphoribosylformylglycinamidine synthase subunit PurL [Alphaproteobacteria bacterium]|nr:phosphoribosylformylglycinamidine synthase subunit PurL [Alphaproteobacteria bacterium]